MLIGRSITSSACITPAAGCADQELSLEAGADQVLLERAQMLLHERLQRRIDGCRGCPQVLAHDRVELVRERVGHTRQELSDQLTKPLLVSRVGDRPEKADRDRFDVPLRHGREDVARGGLVELLLDPALGVDAFGHLVGEVAWDIGRGEIARELERPMLAALAIDQNVGEAFGEEQSGLGDLALDDRVGRARRAVHDHIGRGKQRGRILTELRSQVLETSVEAVVWPFAVAQPFSDDERNPSRLRRRHP